MNDTQQIDRWKQRWYSFQEDDKILRMAGEYEKNQ